MTAPSSSLAPLIETYRGGTLECIHFGAIAVVDAQGKLVASACDVTAYHFGPVISTQ